MVKEDVIIRAKEDVVIRAKGLLRDVVWDLSNLTYLSTVAPPEHPLSQLVFGEVGHEGIFDFKLFDDAVYVRTFVELDGSTLWSIDTVEYDATLILIKELDLPLKREALEAKAARVLEHHGRLVRILNGLGARFDS